MADIVSFGIFGIIFLLMIILICVLSSIQNNNIQSDLAQLSCNYPLYNSIDYLNNTVVYGKGGAYYQCFFCFNCVPQGVSITINTRPYNSTSFAGSFPNGWFMFAGDTIGSFASKTFATLDLGRTVLTASTPFGFNILGYTLQSVNALGQFFIVCIYMVCYIGIGIFLYKSVSPWAEG